MVPAPIEERLRLANQKLQTGTARLQPKADCPVVLKPEDLSSLRIDLSCAADLFGTIASDPSRSAGIENEISQYRSTVEQLARVLPSVQARLLTEKARLEIVQAHMTATAAWAQASKKTV